MNCKSCKKLGKKVVGKNAKGVPYKYYCKMNVFPSIYSNRNKSKSYSLDNYEFYTDEQIDAYIIETSKRLCLKRYDISNSNIISGIALVISIISIFINFNEKDKKALTQIKEIQRQDTLIENRIEVINDSLSIINLKLYGLGRNLVIDTNREKLQNIRTK